MTLLRILFGWLVPILFLLCIPFVWVFEWMIFMAVKSYDWSGEVFDIEKDPNSRIERIRKHFEKNGMFFKGSAWADRRRRRARELLKLLNRPRKNVSQPNFGAA